MNKLLAAVNPIKIGDKFLGTTPLKETEDVGLLISRLITGALSLAGVALLFLLIGGGIGMISGAGSNNPEKLEQGKKAATSALIGFIVVIASYWIVKLIESITGLNLLGI